MNSEINRNISYMRAMLKYCQDILAIRVAFGESYEAFKNNVGYQYAVSFCIEQIGELAKKLREEGFAEKYPDIEWNAIAATRNRIAHGYHVIDLGLVYSTALNDIPKLLRDCRYMLFNETLDMNEKMLLAEAMKEEAPIQGASPNKECER